MTSQNYGNVKIERVRHGDRLALYWVAPKTSSARDPRAARRSAPRPRRARDDSRSAATRVIFRKDKESHRTGEKDGEVFAIFPDVEGSRPGDVAIYGWDGHTEGPYYMQIANSKPAKPHEYAALKRHLERAYGYHLKVASRQARRRRR